MRNHTLSECSVLSLNTRVRPNNKADIWTATHHQLRGTWWRIGWVDACQPKGRGFDSRSSRHVGTLGKSFSYSCLCASAWNSDTVSVHRSRERLRVADNLKGRYINGQNEWMIEWMNELNSNQGKVK